jgi:hypothetical protein
MSTPSFAHHPFVQRQPNRDHRDDVLTRMPLSLGVAALGGALALVLALATGALHTTAQATTVVESAPATVSASAPIGAAWSAVYAQAAPGTVDLAVQATTTVQTPFGQTQEQGTALGSGFVIDGRGDILTAEHVVAVPARPRSPSRTAPSAPHQFSARMLPPTSRSCTSTQPV